MKKTLLWKIGGEAGFGIMTTGLDFAKFAARCGYNTSDYAEYPSLIRGGHNTYEVHFSDKAIRSSKYKIDILVCLNKQTYELHKKRLAPESLLVFDPEAFKPEDSVKCKRIELPLKKILQEEQVSMIMINTVAFGASLALLNWPLERYFEMMQKTFGKKGAEVIEKNKKMASRGYDHIIKTYKQYQRTDFPALEGVEEKLILSGNDAFALGAVVADCRLYVAYPMTPSSTVLTQFAAWAEKIGMVVRHAEDEISVINTALGGSFAGVRSAVGTSGGGFALMVESISYAAVAEIPIVIFLAQRPGPATGMPTWTEQGDLLFAVHAGHGEFPKIVLAAGDIEEMYELGAKAFNLADIYQTPVIVLSDKHLGESHWSTSKPAFEIFSRSYTVQRGKIIEKFTPNAHDEKYLRYHITEDGVSPMLIPGQPGHFYQSNSYEHVEDGHTTEDAQPRIDQVQKRHRKQLSYLKKDFEAPQVFGDIAAADFVFVSWGSNKGVILDALEEFSDQKKHIAYIHFTHLYPLDTSKLKPLFIQGKRYVLIENNSQAQFGSLLREQTGISIEEKILKYDGRQIFKEELMHLINTI